AIMRLLPIPAVRRREPTRVIRPNAPGGSMPGARSPHLSTRGWILRRQPAFSQRRLLALFVGELLRRRIRRLRQVTSVGAVDRPLLRAQLVSAAPVLVVRDDFRCIS